MSEEFEKINQMYEDEHFWYFNEKTARGLYSKTYYDKCMELEQTFLDNKNNPSMDWSGYIANIRSVCEFLVKYLYQRIMKKNSENLTIDDMINDKKFQNEISNDLFIRAADEIRDIGNGATHGKRTTHSKRIRYDSTLAETKLQDLRTVVTISCDIIGLLSPEPLPKQPRLTGSVEIELKARTGQKSRYLQADVKQSSNIPAAKLTYSWQNENGEPLSNDNKKTFTLPEKPDGSQYVCVIECWEAEGSIKSSVFQDVIPPKPEPPKTKPPEPKPGGKNPDAPPVSGKAPTKGIGEKIIEFLDAVFAPDPETPPTPQPPKSTPKSKQPKKKKKKGSPKTSFTPLKASVITIFVIIVLSVLAMTPVGLWISLFMQDADALYEQGWEFLSEEDARMFDYIWIAAMKGNAEAQKTLGGLYAGNYAGIEIEPDGKKAVKKAVRWLQSAAKKGNAEASYDLARIYFDSEGDYFDKELGVQEMKKSAEGGYYLAQCELGDWYVEGLYVGQNFQEAEYWYRETVANNNYNRAKFKLALIHLYGLTDPADEALGIQEILDMANEEKDLYAEVLIGNWYRDGEFGMEQNLQTAAEWYQKNDYIESGFNLNMIQLYVKDGVVDEENWVQAFQETAEVDPYYAGYAQYALGNWYRDGKVRSGAGSPRS